MKIDTALYQLRNQPQMFLQTNLLNLAGAPVSGSRVNYFCRYDGIVHTVNEGFSIRPTPINSIATGIDGKAYSAVGVHSVRMNPNTEDLDVSAIEPYVLGAGGPDIMVTGQLSACIFVVQQVGAQLVVAHIQPGGGRQTATTLRQTLKLMGRFAGYGRATHVFGLGDYAARAYVVGVRKAGAWHLYGQRVAAAGGPIQGVTQII
jgi:hypothetical protein